MATNVKNNKSGSAKGKLILVLIVAIVLAITTVVALIIINKKLYQANLTTDSLVGKYHLLVDNEKSNTVYYDLKTGNVFDFVDGDKTTNGKFTTDKDGDVIKITFDFGDKKTNGTVKSGVLTIGNDAYYKTDAKLPVTSEKLFEYDADGNKTGNYLVLNSDGTYEYVKDGVLYTGTYEKTENGDEKNITFNGDGGLNGGSIVDGKITVDGVTFVDDKKTPTGGETSGETEPETPDTPEIPDEPETPETPEIPDEPETPVTSEKFFEYDADGNKTGNYLELKSDGTYEYVKDGQTFVGTYEKNTDIKFNGGGGLDSGSIIDGKLNIGDISFVEDDKEDGKQEIPYDIDNLKYSVVNYNGHSVISIDGVKDLMTTAVNIPESITHEGKTYPVVTIGYSAFEGCSFLETIIIPNTVLEIGNSAFEDCKNLTNVVLSVNIERIEQNTFANCTELKSIVIPRNVKEIARNAFVSCSRLVTVEFADDSLLTTICDFAFTDCIALTEITIPANVTYLSGFSGCTSLTTVNIKAKNLTSIGNWAFRYCNLSNFTIPATVKDIRAYAFANIKSLSFITFEGDVTAWNAIDKSAYWKTGSNIEGIKYYSGGRLYYRTLK